MLVLYRTRNPFFSSAQEAIFSNTNSDDDSLNRSNEDGHGHNVPRRIEDAYRDDPLSESDGHTVTPHQIGRSIEASDNHRAIVQLSGLNDERNEWEEEREV